MRTKRSWPAPNMSPGMVSRFSSSASRLDTTVERSPANGMLDVGEVGADADQPPAVGARQAAAQQVGARLQALGVLARPGQQVAQAVERRLLAEPRRADRDAVHRLLDLGHQGGARGDAADAVAGQGEDLGEAVEMHQRAAPVRVAEQLVRPRALGQEVLVGLVEQQGDAVLLRQLEEGVDGRRRIDRAGRIVGRDQDDGARPRR